MVPLRINEALTPLSLPNSINIYIDPRGTLFGAALLCFTLPALLVNQLSITILRYALGASAEGLLLHSTPNALTMFDSILLLYVHNPNALRLTDV